MNLRYFIENPSPWFLNCLNHTKANILINWIVDLISVLAHFHESHGRHRDIKLENILIKQQKIYLADFGLANQKEDLSLHAASVSGTERYKAPEMGFAKKYWRKADIFSLACIVIEMLAFGCGISLETFDQFRQQFGTRNCHRTNPPHTCFRHNIQATHKFINSYLRPKTANLERIFDVVQNELFVEEVILRSNACDALKSFVAAASKLPFFQKLNCCKVDTRKYIDLSMESLLEKMRLIHLSGADVGEGSAFAKQFSELVYSGALGENCFAL